MDATPPARSNTHTSSPRSARTALGAGVLGASLLLSSCVGAPGEDAQDGAAAEGYPAKVTSCGFTSEVKNPPTKAVTLNQGATEVMLALGLQDKMAGTAFLDDQVAPELREAYAKVPVLAKEYPSKEKLLAAKPDFIYASYNSGFTPKVAGTQESLQAEGIASYSSPFGCKDMTKRPGATFDAVWDEIDSVATAFGVPDRAEKLRAEQKDELAALPKAKPGLKVLWYDSDTKTPNVGASGGGPQMIMDAVGVTNIFKNLPGNWNTGNWEAVVAADPDVIVLADASWSTPEQKKKYLQSDPVLRNLRAVKNNSFVTLPYSETTPGVRLVDGAVKVAEQISAL